VIGTLKSPQPANTPPHHDRPVRNRTMSDAPRPDFQQQHQQRAPFKDRRLELRKSLYLDQFQQQQQQQQDSDSDSENEATTKNRKYRASAPLLDAYGVPLSPAKQAKALASFQNASPSTTSRNEQQQLPPSDLNQKIRVCVRKRPLSKKEIDKGDKDMAPATGNRSLHINEPK
jgi:hypothetical protein